ncbi:uncharacterized protein K441DRAFT_680024 [Cenococcum geophilum 1.58]|uniref:uncharacterized protein n=1 Tax=Cenococcum geophilum 1.58 TaxID=794803 RepID=UPI0035901043|nr:hypothetical protein K441DRAFT_680024 [Cenococcum geophilum 1.58]
MAMSSDDKSLDEVFDFLIARANDENVPAHPDRISAPAIFCKKTKHVTFQKELPELDIPRPETHHYGDDDGLNLALRACFDRIGWSVHGINIMDIPWELNGEIDFSGISIYDGARQKITLEVFRELNQDFDIFGTSFKDVFPKFDKGDEKEEMKRYWEFMEGMQWGD